jgi:hypothetical protein
MLESTQLRAWQLRVKQFVALPFISVNSSSSSYSALYCFYVWNTFHKYYYYYYYYYYCDGFAQGLAGRVLTHAPRNSIVEAFPPCPRKYMWRNAIQHMRRWRHTTVLWRRFLRVRASTCDVMLYSACAGDVIQKYGKCLYVVAGWWRRGTRRNSKRGFANGVLSKSARRLYQSPTKAGR